VKRVIVVFMVIVAAAGVLFVWIKSHGGSSKPAEEKPAAEESRIKHDENGRVTISMDDETQGNMGLLVAKPAAAQISPELKGYGRVLDPGPLVALTTELSSASAAYSASSNELARLKTLAGQGNASERSLQTAQAVAQRDQLAVLSAKDRLALSWGKALAERNDLFALIQALTSQDAVLVRIDLPAGQTLKAPPSNVRISTLSGNSGRAEFLGVASNVDPQTLGLGSIFLIQPNAFRLLPGEAVTGYLQLPGEPLTGVIIPSEAVVRTEGAGWVYIMNPGGDSFTRSGVELDHPSERGWFVSKSVTTNDYVVVTGAQTLLSEELKASLKPD
jgi:multidrug efflux pump subunit AcrA (membrane-fusion protein)